MKVAKIESTVSCAKFKVKKLEKVDGEPKELDQEFILVLDMKAMAITREKTGIDFLDLDKWFGAEPRHIGTLLWSSFRRFHPEVTEEEASDMVLAETYWHVRKMLMDLCFPGLFDTLVEAKMKEFAAKASEKPAGEPAPAVKEEHS